VSAPPDTPTGVQFPALDGARSTTATGRGVLADAARAIDPALASAIEAEQGWHQGYIDHFRALVASELRHDGEVDAVPRAGLASLHRRFEFLRDGATVTLPEAVALPPARALTTVRVEGRGGPTTELCVPYRGDTLTGDRLLERLDRWVDAGTVEPSFATAIGRVVSNPDWLDLAGRTFVVLGAGAEMGPVGALSRWGATLALVDLPRPPVWRRVLAQVRAGNGVALVPVRGAVDEDDDDAIAEVAGVDLVDELPEAAAWLRTLPDGPLTVGTYVYADGADNVRVSLAADALVADLLAHRGDATVAGLLTPTDVYAAPAEVVAAARRGVAGAGPLRRTLGSASRGRLYAPNYPETVTSRAGTVYGLADCLVPQQGPNYALAKRLARWRLRVARADGHRVSANVAPATSTRSVTKNRVLAAAYAGASRFDVEVFEPVTSDTLMAALLVHDLHHAGAGDPGTALDHPLALFAEAAAHGGMWRQPYSPRTVLPVAAVLGLPRTLR
jgi:hypothetical protein